MNQHALDVLQYPQALQLVAGFASSPLGADAVRSLEPASAAGWIREELERVDQMLAFVRRATDNTLPPIPDVRDALRRLAMPGSVLEPTGLRDLADFMRSARTAADTFHALAERLPLIDRIARNLMRRDDAESAIRRAISDDGEVRDNASRELARIRREMRGARGRIMQRLEQYMATLPARFQVADASISVRDGRYVIPVRREGRGDVGGIVHDESSTGQTLFIEPPIAIELMNQLRELEIAEAREVQRILREVTDALRPHRETLDASLAALVELDSLYARARYADRFDGARPVMLERGDRTYDVTSGRHPLLLGASAPVVPFDLRLEDGERTLLVSGPNTGGKTVLLKAVGLLSALAQAGIIPPVGAGSKLPVFDDVFADIGDEQSIEASLSTFSAHLRNLREIVEQAGEASLVLIDEMGSGTDPVEGAALARAILIELNRRGAFTVATTHLGDLKMLAAEEAGIVNASLDFDAAELKPTYHLRKGVPGRSYGLAIARRLGFPETTLARAEDYVPRSERSLASLLQEVETKDRALAEALRETEEARREALALRTAVQDRQSSLEARERSAERRARQQARDMLLSARAEVEAAIRDLRGAMAKATTEAEREEAIRNARRRVEVRAEAQARRTTVRPRRTSPEAANGGTRELHVGDRVRIEATGAEGTLVELRDARALVDVGGLRMHVSADGLQPAPATAAETAERPKPRAAWSGPDFEPSSEVDLRGLRADEVESRLQPALDAAIQAALPSLRIIHGKGTGALREVVTALLRNDRRVSAFRPGGIGEGGTGVTVVELS
jgi:DNA mismatch repair protein MutS2